MGGHNQSEANFSLDLVKYVPSVIKGCVLVELNVSEQ